MVNSIHTEKGTKFLNNCKTNYDIPGNNCKFRLNIALVTVFVYSVLRESQSLVEVESSEIHIGHFVIDGGITNNPTANK